MSDDKKDLGEELNDMLGDAKEGAKKAADKIKEEAKDFSESAKKVIDEAKEDVKEVYESASTDNGKTVAIIAHLTIIGWIIALIMNGSNKTELGSFYIRQMLGLTIIAVIISWIPFLNLIGGLLMFVVWILSLVEASKESKKPTFLFGEQFQDWFKSL